MKKITLCIFVLIAATIAPKLVAQDTGDPEDLGSMKAFTAELEQKLDLPRIAAKGGDDTVISMEVSGGKTINVSINYHSRSKNQMRLAGKVTGEKNSTFFIDAESTTLMGNILLNDKKIAYTYKTDERGHVTVEASDIDEVLCIGLPKETENSTAQAVNASAEADGPQQIPSNLQSFPGAEACVYLDYDGHYLPPGSRWNNGNPINAAPSPLNDDEIRESFEVVAEDYRPFDVNITTNKAVFDSYPPSRRMWVVFTPTNTAAPGAGGVAYLRSFGFLENEVCWVFQNGAKFSGEAASHEIGHTVGLRHDGLANPSAVYFDGHGEWAPIMGVGYGKRITQFSRGEYNRANNRENDFDIMDNFIRFRGDDHGDQFSNSTFLSKNGDGTVNRQSGVITTSTDLDMFRFTTGTGNFSFDVRTVSRHGNLKVLARLYEGSSGNLIGLFQGSGSELSTRFEGFLDAGTYYLGIDNAGLGNPVTNGFSDYGSLGSYTITGNIAPGGGGGGNDTAGIFIEAESFSDQRGVQTEPSSEGGENVGYTDPGDFMAYSNINFPSSGQYRIEYRVASAVGGGRISSDLNAGSTVLGQIDIPNTGGWQNWTTISQTVNVNAGTYQFGIYSVAGGWNMNWIRITAISNAAATSDVASTNPSVTSSLAAESTASIVPAGQIKTKIYPNPAVNFTKIGFEGNSANISVYDVSGREIIATRTVQSNEEIDLTDMQKGVYIVTIEQEGQKQTKQLIKN